MFDSTYTPLSIDWQDFPAGVDHVIDVSSIPGNIFYVMVGDSTPTQIIQPTLAPVVANKPILFTPSLCAATTGFVSEHDDCPPPASVLPDLTPIIIDDPVCSEVNGLDPTTLIGFPTDLAFLIAESHEQAIQIVSINGVETGKEEVAGSVSLVVTDIGADWFLIDDAYTNFCTSVEVPEGLPVEETTDCTDDFVPPSFGEVLTSDEFCNWGVIEFIPGDCLSGEIRFEFESKVAERVELIVNGVAIIDGYLEQGEHIFDVSDLLVPDYNDVYAFVGENGQAFFVTGSLEPCEINEEEVPEISIPEEEVVVEVPETETPEQEVVVEVPETETPEEEEVVEVPETETPEQEVVVEVPETETPEEVVVVEVPEISIPEEEVVVEVPEISIPEEEEVVVEVPETETPEEVVVVEVPEISIPEEEVVVVEVPETETPEEVVVVEVPEISIPEEEVVVEVPETETPVQEVVVEVPETETPEIEAPIELPETSISEKEEAPVEEASVLTDEAPVEEAPVDVEEAPVVEAPSFTDQAPLPVTGSSTLYLFIAAFGFMILGGAVLGFGKAQA